MAAQNGSGKQTHTARLSAEIDAAYEANKPQGGGSSIEICDVLYEPFLALARHIVRLRPGAYDVDLASDITHRGLLALETFHGECKLSSWFYGIAQNEVNRELERLKQERDRSISIDCRPDDDGYYPVRELAARAEDLNLWLDFEKVMGFLSPDQAEVMQLKVEGYTLEEIAEQTSVPIGTVRSRYGRAKEKFAEAGYKQ